VPPQKEKLFYSGVRGEPFEGGTSGVAPVTLFLAVVRPFKSSGVTTSVWLPMGHGFKGYPALYP